MSEADHFRDERFRQMLEKFLNAIVIVHGFSFAEAQRKQARRFSEPMTNALKYAGRALRWREAARRPMPSEARSRT